MRADLAAHAEAWRWGTKALRVLPAKLHITLHFIGSVPHDRLPELVAGLKVPFKPFDLKLNQPELWRQGLAVLRAEEAPARLVRLHGLLREALQGLELPTEEREFRPHITLARHARGAVPPAQPPMVRWHVDGYALVESNPDPEIGYRIVQSYS